MWTRCFSSSSKGFPYSSIEAITLPSVFRSLLFCSWTWSMPILENTRLVFRTVKYPLQKLRTFPFVAFLKMTGLGQTLTSNGSTVCDLGRRTMEVYISSNPGKCWSPQSAKTLLTWNKVIPSRLLWTNTQHSLISLVGRLSIPSSCALCLVIETPIRIDEPKMPVRLGGHIAFFSLCCRSSNSLCGLLYWFLLSRRHVSSQIHQASCQLQLVVIIPLNLFTKGIDGLISSDDNLLLWRVYM